MMDSNSNDATTTPTFPLHTVRSLVSRINNHVHMMLRDSRVVVEHEELGLFQRNELQLGKLVGTGGFSQVYEVTGFNNHSSSRWYTAEQQETRRRLQQETSSTRYVVKHLKKPKCNDDTEHFCILAADLCVEAQFLASLKHENILSIRGWSAGGLEGYAGGHHDGYFILLDRLVETLEERIHRWRRENEPPSLLSRTKVAHQIGSALQYLHEKNVVFRDLKPDNVGFDEHGTVKLFDFGLARELPKASSSSEVYCMSGEIGTVRYMAPEVALCKEYNAKVDVYSWAVLYWQCLTLEKPALLRHEFSIAPVTGVSIGTTHDPQ